MRISILTLLFLTLYSATGFTQPSGKAKTIFKLINEARANPKAFLAKYQKDIEHYEPKFIALLKRSSSIESITWDKDLSKNCQQIVYGKLKPEYQGTNRMCGRATAKGRGYSNKDALYFVCDSYTHILDEGIIYFGFYIDKKGHAVTWGSSCNPKRYTYQFEGTVNLSKVNQNRLNTAQNETELTTMDKKMIKEINFVRQYPKVYASIIGKLYDGSKLPKDEYNALVELIEELKVMPPAQLLYPKHCVYLAAKKHGEDCKKRGFTDHTGSDGSSPFSRISKFCKGLRGSENLVGGRKNARILVIQLLIDSGISSRGHRYNMLNPKWKYVGCYGYQAPLMYSYIQNFATD